jgi:uncharacterized membrane protein
MNQNKLSFKRHIAKTISYRIISTLVGFTVMWWVTGNIKVGTAFGVLELVYKPIQYYIHERVWYRFIKFGINDKPKKPRAVKAEEPKIEKPKDGVKRLNYTRR